MWRDYFSVGELEFLAEQTMIEIKPNFRKEELKLLGGTYGPFKPNKHTKIPLWLAVQYRKNKKCEIKTPIWLNKEFLTQILTSEKENPTVLQSLPYYFYEITQIIFHVAQEDITDFPDIRILVENISSVRQSKINKIIEAIPLENLTLNLNSICAKELEKIRIFLNESFGAKYEILTNESNFNMDQPEEFPQ